jgi:hypothetical protein
VFLGAFKNDVGLEIQRRIQIANLCFSGLPKHMRSSHLARQIKLTIYKILIRLVLLYGSETWVLTKREENQLLVFERKVLRTIYGPKIVNSVYRSSDYNSSNVVCVLCIGPCVGSCQKAVKTKEDHNPGGQMA